MAFFFAAALFSTAKHSTTSRGLTTMSRNVPFLPHENVITSGNKVVVSDAQKMRLTLTTSIPFFRADCNIATFSVKFHKKDKKTAIGFSAVQPPTDTYLIPDYYSGSQYISMGGAGFIYPMRTSASKGYKEGDLITVKLNFTEGTIAFSVNGVQVSTCPWPANSSDQPILSAYPFISAEGGLLEMEVLNENTPETA